MKKKKRLEKERESNERSRKTREIMFQRKKREKYQNEKEMNWISNDPKNPGTLGYILVTEIKRKRWRYKIRIKLMFQEVIERRAFIPVENAVQRI